MNINDLLKEHAPVFDRRLTQMMEEAAGKEVLSEIEQTFPDAEDARDWFYTYIMISELDQKRPYDLCKIGHRDKVIQQLKIIRYDNY